MASASVVPASGVREPSGNAVAAEKLPDEMNDMKIRDDREMEPAIVDGNGAETGHIIVTTIGGRNGQPKQTISYMAERVVGHGSFGVVFQAKCLETGEAVAIKKVLQDKRYKNRELQTMRVLDHPNVVALKHCFFSTTEKEELYLNLVLEYVPETVHRVIRHNNKMNQRMPMIYVKLYSYQIFRALAYIHGSIGVVCIEILIKPQALLQQSKKKKAPRSISVTTIALYSVVTVVMTLVSKIEEGTSNFQVDDEFLDSKKSDVPRYAVFNTSKGLITVELYKEGSPEVVDEFIDA
ncbi:hypothetical protein M8C21_013401, partial [Ambrosia artemisiifolia]